MLDVRLDAENLVLPSHLLQFRPASKAQMVENPSFGLRPSLNKGVEFLSGMTGLAGIDACLRRAIPPSDVRNMLAHGRWWAFDVETKTITVRATTAWPDEELHRDFTEEDIERTVSDFEDLEAELFHLQRQIERRKSRPATPVMILLCNCRSIGQEGRCGISGDDLTDHFERPRTAESPLRILNPPTYPFALFRRGRV
jgi:hypothetical protein